MDPRTPVIVGSAQLTSREGATEPIDLMCQVIDRALGDSGAERSLRTATQSLRPIQGIWPYKDPGRLVAERLGLDGVVTGLTPIGGNEVYDLFSVTAEQVAAGDVDVVVICSAESLRTRRSDWAAGRRSTYLDEREEAAPDEFFGIVHPEMQPGPDPTGARTAVNFYAMAETALRHRLGEPADIHLERIAALWATASTAAVANPDAALPTERTAAEIARAGRTNRMVASPYPKLMTSNIDVDQAAAVIVCSAAAADAAGVPRERWVFPWSGTGAVDAWNTLQRAELDRSPAMRHAGRRALELAELQADEVGLLDLYSCFPAAVQVAEHELGIDPARPFTITGGLTFSGGPLNSYCLHALAWAAQLLRADGARTALLSGNGGFFTKHSFVVLGSTPSPVGYRCEASKDEIEPANLRPLLSRTPATGSIEGYTVTFDADGAPDRAILSVLAETEPTSSTPRLWANSRDEATIAALLAADACGRSVALDPTTPEVPQATLI